MADINKKNRNLKIIFWGILLLGVLIRCIRFGQVPGGVNQDEAMAAVDAWALSKYGTDRYGMALPVHFTAWKVSQMSVLLSYLMIPFLKLFGLRSVAVRMPMLIISCGTIVLMYLVGKKVFSERTGLILMALCAVNPWHFMQSRWSLDCNLFPHVFLLALYLLLAGLEKHRYLYLSMIFFGLTFYCYGVAVYSVIPFLIVYAAWCLWRKQLKLTQVLLCIVIFSVIALPEIIVMAINLFGWDTMETPLFTMARFPESSRADDILFMNFSFRQLLRNILSMVKQVFLQLPDHLFNALPEFGPLYHLSIPFTVIGIAAFVRQMMREKDRQVQTRYMAILGFFLTGIWVGIITFEVNINRINIIFYPMIMLCGYGIEWLIQRVKRCKLMVCVAALYGICVVLFLARYFTFYQEESRVYYNQDFLNAVAEADSMEEYEQLYITGNMGWQFNCSMAEILTQYACEIDALYYQEKTNTTNGREQLPYSQRYHFVDNRILEEQNVSAEGYPVLFLIHETDLPFMDCDVEVLEREGEFLIAAPVKEEGD